MYFIDKRNDLEDYDYCGSPEDWEDYNPKTTLGLYHRFWWVIQKVETYIWDIICKYLK